MQLSEVFRNKALASGAGDWLEALPALVAELERDWEIRVGRSYDGGTEAFVAEATTRAGEPAVLKLLIPRSDGEAESEIEALRVADGRGCARLLRGDPERSALLLERLGRRLAELGLPIGRRHEILCAAAGRMWRSAPGAALMRGDEKARWLVDFIAREWEALGRPCSERAVEHALRAAERRAKAHDDERAVLVHGDVHEWNALECETEACGFKLVDPDGLLAEPEYDLGVLMREDPVELMQGDPRERAARLAALTGCDAGAIWDWGIAERVSTGLVCTRISLQPVGRQMLDAADRIAASA